GDTCLPVTWEGARCIVTATTGRHEFTDYFQNRYQPDETVQLTVTRVAGLAAVRTQAATQTTVTTTLGATTEEQAVRAAVTEDDLNYLAGLYPNQEIRGQ